MAKSTKKTTGSKKPVVSKTKSSGSAKAAKVKVSMNEQIQEMQAFFVKHDRHPSAYSKDAHEKKLGEHLSKWIHLKNWMAKHGELLRSGPFDRVLAHIEKALTIKAEKVKTSK